MTEEPDQLLLLRSTVLRDALCPASTPAKLPFSELGLALPCAPPRLVVSSSRASPVSFLLSLRLSTPEGHTTMSDAGSMNGGDDL